MIPSPKAQGDRVAWIGSSSTRIGVWPRTMEFLLRTRHPGLRLQFRRFGINGVTFEMVQEKLDGWLDEFRPTVVFFNLGVNDAIAGEEGLGLFEDDMEQCVARVKAHGARVVLITPQAADIRKAGPSATARRTLYAEAMLNYGREQGWTVVDIHHPLQAMQRANQQADRHFTILRDSVHLTHSACVGWGFIVYDRLDPPFVKSAATLTATGEVVTVERCAFEDVYPEQDGLSFTRIDEVQPILPPGSLPPRLSVPLEAYSRFLLKVTGLMPGRYEIRCEGHLIGTVHSGALTQGLNLNSLLLQENRVAPWEPLAHAIWDGTMLDRIGQTRWRFEVRKQSHLCLRRGRSHLAGQPSRTLPIRVSRADPRPGFLGSHGSARMTRIERSLIAPGGGVPREAGRG